MDDKDVIDVLRPYVESIIKTFDKHELDCQTALSVASTVLVRLLLISELSKEQVMIVFDKMKNVYLTARDKTDAEDGSSPKR